MSKEFAESIRSNLLQRASATFAAIINITSNISLAVLQVEQVMKELKYFTT